jgi:hypothetical protein
VVSPTSSAPAKHTPAASQDFLKSERCQVPYAELDVLFWEISTNGGPLIPTWLESVVKTEY